MSQVSEATPALEAIGIHKRFGGVVANDDVNLRVEKGRIHALLGENGAGKSTLVNILFGLYRADRGEVRVAGEVVDLGRPRDAIDRGIGMVHQHFQLVPVLTVAENVVLGDEPSHSHAMFDLGAARRAVQELASVTASKWTRRPWSRTSQWVPNNAWRSSGRSTGKPTC